jgi:hypothetical protein
LNGKHTKTNDKDNTDCRTGTIVQKKSTTSVKVTKKTKENGTKLVKNNKTNKTSTTTDNTGVGEYNSKGKQETSGNDVYSINDVDKRVYNQKTNGKKNKAKKLDNQNKYKTTVLKIHNNLEILSWIKSRVI